MSRPQPRDPDGPAVTSQEAARLTLAQWREGGTADTLAAVARYPQLRDDKSSLLDLIFEEYVRRLGTPTPVDAEYFCRQFPEIQSSIRGTIEIHEILVREAALLADADFRWPEPGDRVLGYDVRERIGRGAFARVYRAHEPEPDREVVLKVEPHISSIEAGALARISHPNVIPLYLARVIDELKLVLVMPYVGKATLADLIDGRRAAGNALSGDALLQRVTGVPTGARPRSYERLILDLAIQLAEGLAATHAQGVCHRDLKPSNIVLSRDGKPVLVDFNLAADLRRGLNQYGGTPDYMAPEQARAALTAEPATVDERADLFSLGAVLYEALSGEPPFGRPRSGRGASLAAAPAELAALLLDRQQRGFRPLVESVLGVRPDFDRVIRRCLSLDPAGRPASAAELAAELRRLAVRDPVARRRRIRCAVVLSAALALGGTCLGTYLAARRPAAERAFARGVEELRRGENAAAVADLVKADEPGDRRPSVSFLRGLALMRLGHFNHAVTQFEEADRRGIEDGGQNAAALAYCYAIQGDYKEARSWFEKAKEQGWKNAAVWNNSALSEIHAAPSRDWEKILKELRRAKLMAPDSPEINFNLAQSITSRAGGRAGRDAIGDAITLLDAVREKAAHPELLRFGATLLCRRGKPGDFERALEWLNRAVDLGLNPATVSTDPQFAVLRSSAAYSDLLRREPGPLPGGPLPTLIDPLADFMP